MRTELGSGGVVVDLDQDNVTQSKELGIALADMGSKIALLVGPEVVLDALMVAYVTIAKATGSAKHGAESLPGALAVLQDYAGRRDAALVHAAGSA